MDQKPSLKEIFLVFLKVGAFTFGGGYAMIPLFRHEMVVKRHWLTEEGFNDALILSQGAPGAIAVNIAVHAGFSLRGIVGSLSAVLGVTLPSFLVILTIALLLPRVRENPIVVSAFKGLRPAILALILYATVGIGRRTSRHFTPTLVSGLALLGLLFGLHPAIVLVAAGLWGILASKPGVKNG